MKLVDLSVLNFINEVDSLSPAPGGGSVSALVGSLSCALARMVGHLTIDKKKFIELDNSIKEKFLYSFNELKKIELELNNIIDKDTDNFNMVMKAIKMPKETEEEKTLRNKYIQEATINATKTPMDILELSLKIFSFLDIFVEYGNKNALSDVAVAYVLAYASAKGAMLNVNINLPSIEDKKIYEEYRNKCIEYIKNIEDKFCLVQKQIALFTL